MNESEIIAELTDVLGEDDMRTYGGFWRKRFLQNPDALKTALADLRGRILSSKRPRLASPGAWLRVRFNQLHEMSVATPVLPANP